MIELWANADGNKNKLITQHALYRHLGTNAAERQCAYRQLFRAAIERSDLDVIREATNQGWVLGNNRFRERIERLSGRRSAPRSRGEGSQGNLVNNSRLTPIKPTMILHLPHQCSH
ncbi:MAG: hypothetical protein V3U88_13065 [Methylococcales bacterium]